MPSALLETAGSGGPIIVILAILSLLSIALIVGIIGGVVGTRIGSQWMRRVDARLLDGLFAAAVTAGALRLLLGWVL